MGPAMHAITTLPPMNWRTEPVVSAAPRVIDDGVQTEPPFPGQTDLTTEHIGSIIVALEPWPEGEDAVEAAWPRPDAILRVDRREPRDPALDPASRGALGRCWFAVYMPEAPRGVAVLMPGMFGTPRWIIEQWTSDLLARDWAVLRMLTQPSRFTEFRLFDLDVGLETTADRVARTFDARLEASAESVRLAAGQIEVQHPALVDLPRIAIGLSGGALILPTVVAGEPDRYRAGVILAGGADLVTVVSESNYAPFIGAVALRRGARTLTPGETAMLSEAYLQRTRLDPYAVAPGLARVPMLIVQGTRDRAVPASCGDLLWERLERPTRWAWPVGHELLALALQTRFGEVLDWLDARAPQVGVLAP